MTDRHSPASALAARAERGAPRGADAVLAAARRDAADLPAPAEVPSRDRRRTLAVAAALVLVGAGVAAVAWRQVGGADDVSSSGSGFCAALEARSPDAPPADLVRLYLYPDADAATIDRIRSEIESDEQVESASYVDRDETYAEFRTLFADQPKMLDATRPTDLPTSFAITVADGADPATVTARLRTTDGAMEAVDASTIGPRTLDLLVWAGHNPHVMRQGSTGIGFRPYGASWPDQLATLRATAAPEVIAAIDELQRELDARTDRLEPPSLEDPAFVRAAAAAEVIERAAAEECGLAPLPNFGEDRPEGEVRTAETIPAGSLPGD